MSSWYGVHIFCCTNQRDSSDPRGCCGADRGDAIRIRFAEKLKEFGVRRARANKAGCMDRCALGPCVVIYPDAVWYRVDRVPEDVDEIVERHIVGGAIVERLRLPDRPG